MRRMYFCYKNMGPIIRVINGIKGTLHLAKLSCEFVMLSCKQRHNVNSVNHQRVTNC